MPTLEWTLGYSWVASLFVQITSNFDCTFPVDRKSSGSWIAADWMRGRVMAARVGPPATLRCKPRQARKGAAAAADSGAGVWLVQVATLIQTT